MAQRPTENATPPATTTTEQALRTQLDNMMRERLAIRVEIAQMPDGAKEMSALRQQESILEERMMQTRYELERLKQPVASAGPALTTSPWVSPPPLPNEYVLLGALFMVVTFLPISIALARRIWRRNEPEAVALSQELEGRMLSMQTAVETMAVEVERIGEGQRFVAGLLHSHLGGATQDARVSMPEAVAKREMRNAVTPH